MLVNGTRRQEGDRGLIHSSRGKESNSSFEKNFKEKILTLYEEKYWGFGPTFAAEKLAEEDKCFLSHETLRQWLKQQGLWQNVRKRNPYRKKRERRKQFGELLQLDGSFHRWFGDDQPEACLMNMVDDATGKTLSLMGEEETTEAAMRILLKWVKRYGVPKSLYVDLKSVYVSCWEYERTVQNDWTISFRKRYLQIENNAINCQAQKSNYCT